MVKPVSLENPLNNQFSELASNNFKTNKGNEATKGTASVEQAIAKAEVANVNENATLKNTQDVQVKKTEKESTKELEQSFAEISEFMNLYNRNVNFSMDERSDKTIIKVFDSDSKELIKQFPSEDLVKLAQKIRELRQDVDLKSGIFLDEKV